MSATLQLRAIVQREKHKSTTRALSGAETRCATSQIVPEVVISLHSRRMLRYETVLAQLCASAPNR